MSTEGTLLLALLAAWQSLPSHEREFEHGIVALTAESYLRGSGAATTYRAVCDITTLAAPIPCPFVFTRGQA